MAYGQVVDVRIEGAPIVPGTPAEKAFRLLRFGFALLPILAGLDKFFNTLVYWEMYLAPALAQWLPVSPGTFMRAVGLVEIAAGVLVAVNPKLGGKVVAVWLWGIIANLLMARGFYDIAARDLVLSFGALALSQLAAHRELSRPIVTMPAHQLETAPLVPSHA